MRSREWNEDQWTPEFYQGQRKRLFQIAKNLKLPEHLIEDAVQMVLLKVARQWDSIREPDEQLRLRALSRKIMHDTAADLLRRRDRRRSASLNEVAQEPVDDRASNPAEQLAMGEMTKWVKARLEELRQQHPQYAWLLSENFLSERPIEELAAEKGVAKHALECQKTRALKAFRRLLEKHDPDGEISSL
jgi:DNA-directed RNA polymerase specialized sigma24 family protein